MKQAGLISGPPSQGKEDDGYEGKGALLRRIRPDTGGQQAGAKNVDQAEQGLKMQGDMVICKRAARTVLTGMCYSVGSATRQGSSSLTRFIGQSAMTSRT